VRPNDEFNLEKDSGTITEGKRATATKQGMRGNYKDELKALIVEDPRQR